MFLIKLNVLCFFFFAVTLCANLNAADDNKMEISMKSRWLRAEPETPTLPQGIINIKKIHLYSSIPTFQSRLPDPVILGEYSKKIQDRLAQIINSTQQETHKNGFVAVAMKPDKQMKLWVDLDDSFNGELTEALVESLKGIEAPSVTGGPVAFAIVFTINGGRDGQSGVVPMPELWRKAADDRAQTMFEKNGEKILFVVPDDILKIVWPDEP